jgi:predicted extracellular nuclease
MFFSEYLEGSSFNKAIELYNPTDLILNLSEYEVRLYSNASLVPTNTEILTGTLAPGETLVLINDQASAAIQNQADLVSGATFFNGNDALELVHNGVVIDVIGIVGDDPAGEFWVVGDGGTNEHTLVRKVEITEGTTDWAIGATQWDVYNQDNVSFLGSHTAYPCSETPQVNMSNSGLFVNEGAGSVTFNVQAFNLTD